VPEPGDGEVLMRTRWLSLDPYMRGRMSADGRRGLLSLILHTFSE
jgi:NADPH-dependent curcumin reductase CurA